MIRMDNTDLIDDASEALNDAVDYDTPDHWVSVAASVGPLIRALKAADATLAAIRAARSNFPVCAKHPDDDIVSCGWKRAVLDIDKALEATE